MKKGQIVLVGSLLILVLVILMVIASAFIYSFSNNDIVGYKRESKVFNFGFNLPQMKALFIERDCCNQDVYLNYFEEPEEIVVLDYDYVHFVSNCDGCNKPKISNQEIEKESETKILNYKHQNYVSSCQDCNKPKISRQEIIVFPGQIVPSYEHINIVRGCCDC